MIAEILSLLLGVATPAEAALAPPATIVTHERVFALQGASNFRDIGGYATTDGGTVRWGRVFRSDALSRLTPDDAARIEQLRLQAVVDLRTEEERLRAPDLLLKKPAFVYVSPKQSTAPLGAEILRKATSPEAAGAAITDFYARMPDLYRAEYAAFFRQLATGSTPLLVHCTAGKDRTGVAVALLLTALGVPRQTVVSDYALTNSLLPFSDSPAARAALPASMADMPQDVREILWSADPAFVAAALDSIDRRYGSIDSYLETGLGLSKAEIRTMRRSLVAGGDGG